VVGPQMTLPAGSLRIENHKKKREREGGKRDHQAGGGAIRSRVKPKPSAGARDPSNRFNAVPLKKISTGKRKKNWGEKEGLASKKIQRGL